MLRRVPLSRRLPIRDTLQIMVHLVQQSRDDEAVRDTAVRLTRNCPRLDEPCRMRAVLGFVKSTVNYERDVRSVETIRDPRTTLEQIQVYGNSTGDCDDASVLMATLLESLGIKTRFLAISTRRDGRFHHVAVEAQQKGGPWHYLDAYSRQESTARFTRTLRVAV